MQNYHIVHVFKNIYRIFFYDRISWIGIFLFSDFHSVVTLLSHMVSRDFVVFLYTFLSLISHCHRFLYPVIIADERPTFFFIAAMILTANKVISPMIVDTIID